MAKRRTRTLLSSRQRTAGRSHATDGSFTAGTPQFLFNLNYSSATPAYELNQDGQHILTQEMPVSNRDRTGARLIQNWTALLEL